MELVKGPTYSHEEMLAHMVAQYEVILLRTCYMYLHDKALAEDATQETFLKAYKALDSFCGESSEKTWLMRIAMNTCRDSGTASGRAFPCKQRGNPCTQPAWRASWQGQPEHWWQQPHKQDGNRCTFRRG